MKKVMKKYIPMFVGKWYELVFFFTKQKALDKAFVLFCTPRRGKVLSEQEYFLEAAEDEVVIVMDHEIQTYQWSGTEETILLVHGWESNTYRWKALIEKFKESNYTIVAFDAPAHGNSSGKLFNVPLYATCLQKVIELYRPNYILGHSIGGLTTMFNQYTYTNSEIEKLVILAPPAELATMIKGFQKTLRLSRKFMKAFDDYFKEKFGFHFEEFSAVAFSKDFEVKGLCIHDKYDKIASYLDTEKIQTSWKGLQFVTTSNFGHSLYVDEVDEVILNFLKE